MFFVQFARWLLQVVFVSRPVSWVLSMFIAVPRALTIDQEVSFIYVYRHGNSRVLRAPLSEHLFRSIPQL